MTALWRLSAIEARFFLRERQAMFWTLFFPVFMLLFFGQVFGGPGYIEFLVPGLVGMNLMSVSFFSVGALLVGYRERGVLKRLRATPLTPATFIAAQILNRYAITLAQALILFVLAWLVFGVRPRGSPAAVLVALTVGLLAFMTLGFTIASLARTQASATGIANVFFLPALFLGGAYFPVETFPPLLRTIGTSLPLAPFLEGFRGIYSRGLPLDAVSGPLLIVAGWGVVGALLSVRLFRWQ